LNFKKLWTKVFGRNSETEEIALHVSGATVRHDNRNPFENLEVPRNGGELSYEFIDRWVAPFYMTSFSNADDTTILMFAEAASEINVDIVKSLLGDFNWRTRIAGAFFAAINNYKEVEDIIGKHLLKSELAYAGSGYCLALAAFTTEKAKDFLTTYLNYYLDRKDLWFNQADAFCALEHLDKDIANTLVGKWESFVADKEQWKLEISREHFSRCMLTLDKIRKAKALS
jgi:hypothetical protein